MLAKGRSSGVAPFVGRERELGLLGQWAEEARAGRPRLALIEADRGFGKSALLTSFLAGLGEARVLRASGDQAEAGLPFGVVGQLLASAGRPAAVAPGTAPAEPLAVGAELVALLCSTEDAGSLTVIAVDDLHWADSGSAAALLYTVRRIHAEPVLTVVTAAPAGLARLGDGWCRLALGDHRAARLRLAGLDVAEIAALGRELGTAEIAPHAAARLRDFTGGSPFYCRALLEETDPREWGPGGRAIPVPPALGGMVAARLAALSGPARDLTQAAAVCGQTARLAVVNTLAALADPVLALDEAVGSGLVKEEERADGRWLAFPGPLVHLAVYQGIGPARRHRLHERAAGFSEPQEALAHRFAATTGPCATLAADLESAAREAEASPAQAAAWLAKAAAVAPDAGNRGRLLLDAFEYHLRCGDAAGAEALADQARALPPSSRRSLLLGHLDLLAGRVQAAADRLEKAWREHDPAIEPSVGAQAALRLAICSAISGRPPGAVDWAELAVGRAGGDDALRSEALGVLAVLLASAGSGPQALAALDFLAPAPAEIPTTLTDVLVARGMVRVMTDDLASGVADLAAAAGRLAAGAPLRYGSQCLGRLAEAHYRLGNWDDAAGHGEAAVSAAREAGRRWDLAFLHSIAALVPAARGDWEAAEAHVAAAAEGARAVGGGIAVAAWASARAALGAARGDHEEVLRAAASVRATGRPWLFGQRGRCGWHPLEVAALISTGDLDGAQSSLAELAGPLTPSSPASLRMTAAWLRGALAGERGDSEGAQDAFRVAGQLAGGLPMPFHTAWMEMADGRRLRQAGRRPEAIARLRSARIKLATLRAAPYLAACDVELAACGVKADASSEALGLTPAELAVARLVAAGRSNREAAAELFVSVKAIEFHLGNIFAKLGIRSRRAIAERLGEPLARPGGWGQNSGRT